MRNAGRNIARWEVDNGNGGRVLTKDETDGKANERNDKPTVEDHAEDGDRDYRKLKCNCEIVL